MLGPISSLLAKINAFAVWLQSLVKATLGAFFDMLRDCVVWVFDKVGDMVVAAIQGIDISGISTNIVSWGSLPGEVVNALGLLRVGQAAAIITTAIGIRLVLQLIPFTRLGS